ncbi:MAG: FHA domain-containing protein, partial [Myxococcales bacterium]|nr:FHA domain-containing protein [Myxococcales bacterium]
MSDSTDQGQSTVITIGSSGENDIVFNRPTVSSFHARIFWSPQRSAWFLEDIGSTNGTFVRGVKLVPNQPVAISLGDNISLGKKFTFELRQEHLGPRQSAVEKTISLAPDTAEVPLVRPKLQLDLGASGSHPAASGGPEHTMEIAAVDVRAGRATPPIGTSGRLGAIAEPPPPDSLSISLGYADDNDVQIKNPVVSGHHARLYRVGNGYLLEDLGSTNGTWLGGRRIVRAEVFPDASFSLGNYAVSVADLLPYFDSLSEQRRLSNRDRAPIITTPVVIGRDPSCDIRLDAPMVSATHARLSPEGNGLYTIEDLQSTNGTFVNSRDHQV